MKTIYQIFDAKQPDGTWFKAYQVPEELDLPPGYINLGPPDDLINPRFDYQKGWIEDEEALLEGLKQENKELKDRLNMTEGAL
ncbi:hypothetical protein, partial [Enterococcus dongliensis]|uniref:hypothetical protein n=1 Tax=Enterococcus dongliensis TaxID=2559925 RepID=UPI002890155A